MFFHSIWSWIVDLSQNTSPIEQLMKVMLVEKLLETGVTYGGTILAASFCEQKLKFGRNWELCGTSQPWLRSTFASEIESWMACAPTHVHAQASVHFAESVIVTQVMPFQVLKTVNTVSDLLRTVST